MITVSFARGGQEIARLEITAGRQPAMFGDCSWLDFSYSPYSARLARKVSFAEDAEEWARSLPDAYAGTGVDVRVSETPSSSPASPEPPAPAATSEPPATSSPFRAALRPLHDSEKKFEPLFQTPSIPGADEFRAALQQKARARERAHEQSKQ